jgi:hypothetical protein
MLCIMKKVRAGNSQERNKTGLKEHIKLCEKQRSEKCMRNWMIK